MSEQLHIPRLNWKISIIGDEKTGKTSVVRRFVTQKFDQNYIPTLGINISVYSTKLLIKNQFLDAKFSIWDVAGQNSFRMYYKHLFSGSNGLILLFDLTRLSTFLHLEYWLKTALENNISSEKILLVGNKVDLNTQIHVENGFIREFQENHHIPHYFSTSALNGQNILEVFQYLGEKLYQSVF